MTSFVRLSAPLVLGMSIGRYHSHVGGYNSASFDDFGDSFVCAGEDRSIALFNADSAGQIKAVNVRSSGCAHVCFTHSRYDVVAASTVGTHIAYLSLHDNRTHRHLIGHRGAVASLCVSPVDDTLLSASVDGTARIWDLRSPMCAGIIAVEGGTAPTAAFDSDGVVFAVAAGGAVELFDKRSYEAGSFTQFVLPSAPAIQRIAFSPDGSLIAVAGAYGLTMIDAFEGAVKWSAPSPKHHELRFAFAPDANVVLATTDDESAAVVRAHNTADGQFIGALPHPTATQTDTDVGGAIRAIAFAPNRALIVTADSRGLALRIPTSHD